MKTLLKAKKFSVVEKDITTPKGKSTYEIIAHPGAVVILPFLNPETLLLIKNHRYSIDKELIELPAGTLEKGEDILACAHRELEEETGYKAKEMKPLFNFYSSPGFCNERLFIFVATNLSHIGQKLEETEQITVQPVKFTKALRMIREGLICDAKSIASILYYHQTCILPPT